MNIEFISPFLSSMSNVLVTMASLKPRASGFQLEPTNLPEGDVTGIIPLSSPQASGTIALTFSKAVILHIAEKMLGEEFDELNDKVADLVGELANMVAGNARELLEDKGYTFEMGIPKVIRGPNRELTRPQTSNLVIVPFSTEAGEFYVEVSINSLEF
ncbi:chemotaxis protein CheX [Aliikangiella sp. G2MR2-5]|uniref:chemotaxis protein CheX n=1 Tax=Aliikangiella sp. G2MR2-5 TaxID=2788943 RepID=UPI0018A95BC5|nr:chemotaxis protein CheX [Aliikangiella sp. G2MR2-5]